MCDINSAASAADSSLTAARLVNSLKYSCSGIGDLLRLRDGLARAWLLNQLAKLVDTTIVSVPHAFEARACFFRHLPHAEAVEENEFQNSSLPRAQAPKNLTNQPLRFVGRKLRSDKKVRRGLRL